MAMAARVPLVALACLLSLFPHTVAEAEQSQDEALCAVRRSLVMSGATAAGWLCLASFPHVPVCLWEGVQCDERQRVLSINLAGRGVSGAISPSLGHLPSLQSVYLFDNDLTGGIPDSLGLLSELRALDVRGNRLTGPVPPSLCALQHLHSLLLDGNAGLGAIPSCLQLTPDPDAPPDDASGERLATPEPTSQPNDNSTRVFDVPLKTSQSAVTTFALEMALIAFASLVTLGVVAWYCRKLREEATDEEGQQKQAQRKASVEWMRRNSAVGFNVNAGRRASAVTVVPV